MREPHDANLAIRPLKTWDEFLAAEELQRLVWQMPDWRDAVPGNMLIAAQKNGGLSLGAFDGETLAGFTFSFLGLEKTRAAPYLKHHSHMLAVLPVFQSRKIGARLKWAQREHVLAQGIDLVTWTYDPLLALNARLNLVHLGALARHYLVNAYGEMTDGLNAGLASDRFQIEWWLNSPRVVARKNAAPPRTTWDAHLEQNSQAAFDLTWDEHGLPHITRANELDGDTLLVEIPTDLNAIKATSLEFAREWREQTRRVFQNAFAAGWVATDLVTTSQGTRARVAYVLTRTPRDAAEL